MFGLDLLEVRVAEEKEENRELTQDETLELFETEMKKLREPKEDLQLIVLEKELEGYLKDGGSSSACCPPKRF